MKTNVAPVRPDVWRDRVAGTASRASLLLMVGPLLLLGVVRAQAPAQTSPHGTLSIPCEDCHTSTSWTEVSGAMKFDHRRTKFPLLGQHVQVACKQCHQDLKFASAPILCADCHTDIHRGELGKTCDRCHAPQSWLIPDMTQKHNGTRFPLMGPHQSLPCQSCHINQQKQEYINVPVDCYGCHRSTYDATVSPAHRAAGFGTDCQQCHSMTAFAWGGSFNHDLTPFPLTGAHVSQPCAQCHPSGKFAGTPTQCSSCHISQYNAAMNPVHNPGFPTDCASCHTTAGWSPALFDHNKTSFPLTGAHAARPCSDCHKTNQFAGIPVQCYSCHQSDYSNPATVPTHTLGLSTDCTGCHNTTAWVPSTMNHASYGFTLTGAHTTTACNTCHKTAYAGTPTACYGCHQADYNGTTNPIHSSAGFPTTCQTCHTTTSWAGATFNHTWFPTSHGNAAGICANCHTSQTDFSQYQCTVCHTQAQTDPHHTGVQNYVYSSPACYSCHPNGRTN